MKLDPWQKEFLRTPGNKCLRSGRQAGKSTVVGKYGGDYALKHPGKTVLIIAAVERQAYLLFDKIMQNIPQHEIQGRPTKTKVTLKNGSVIYCLPTGLSGNNIRGYTIDLLIADEAAFIPDEVWTAVTPMLSTTHGDIILLSTPFGREGYFYRCFSDPSFTSFHVSSEDCPRIPKEFLEKEQARMTKVQYAQEYLGEFIDELRQFFPTQLIESCMTLQRGSIPLLPSEGTYSLGVDVAGMGTDETVLATFKLNHRERLQQVDQEIYKRQRTTDTIQDIKQTDSKYNCKKIYIDDGGIGAGVFDTLLKDSQTKRKVEAINNSSRSIDRTGRNKRLLKEDLYNNLKVLMEQQRIAFLDDEDTFESLKSIQVEIQDGNLKIFGRYTHITEAIIRAAWIVQEKGLKLWIA